MSPEPKSKTLVKALSELEKGLENSNSITICDLAKQLAENLHFNYRTYIPYGKSLQTSIDLQTNKLYSATFTLVDNVQEQKARL